MSWYLAEDASADEQRNFASLAKALSHQGEAINDSKANYTTRVKVGGKHYFVKHYRRPGKYLRRYLGHSRPNREWLNARWFKNHGIPFPRRVCFGEENRRQSAYSGVIVFEEIPDSMDLRNISRYRPDLMQDPDWRRRVMINLADVVRRMHQQGFIHNDLNWRNVLVQIGGSQNGPEASKMAVYLIDSPAGRRVYLTGNRRGIVRDLAFLDKMAGLVLSNTDRLRFFMYYRGVTRLGKGDKQELRRVLGFFK